MNGSFGRNANIVSASMQCPSCANDVDAGARFCPQCGVRLSRVCPMCGTEAAATATACEGCGAHFSAGSEVTVAPPVAKPPASDSQAESVMPLRIGADPEPERRQTTLMFCDLVGSTALSASLDPEDLRDVLRGFREAAGAVVSRHEGFVASYMGDGILVFFGYPQAHEDDAERAVRAGLDMAAAVQALRTLPGSASNVGSGSPPESWLSVTSSAPVGLARKR